MRFLPFILAAAIATKVKPSTHNTIAENASRDIKVNQNGIDLQDTDIELSDELYAKIERLQNEISDVQISPDSPSILSPTLLIPEIDISDKYEENQVIDIIVEDIVEKFADGIREVRTTQPIDVVKLIDILETEDPVKNTITLDTTKTAETKLVLNTPSIPLHKSGALLAHKGKAHKAIKTVHEIEKVHHKVLESTDGVESISDAKYADELVSEDVSKVVLVDILSAPETNVLITNLASDSTTDSIQADAVEVSAKPLGSRHHEKHERNSSLNKVHGVKTTNSPAMDSIASYADVPKVEVLGERKERSIKDSKDSSGKSTDNKNSNDKDSTHDKNSNDKNSNDKDSNDKDSTYDKPSNSKPSHNHPHHKPTPAPRSTTEVDTTTNTTIDVITTTPFIISTTATDKIDIETTSISLEAVISTDTPIVSTITIVPTTVSSTTTAITHIPISSFPKEIHHNARPRSINRSKNLEHVRKHVLEESKRHNSKPNTTSTPVNTSKSVSGAKDVIQKSRKTLLKSSNKPMKPSASSLPNLIYSLDTKKIPYNLRKLSNKPKGMNKKRNIASKKGRY